MIRERYEYARKKENAACHNKKTFFHVLHRMELLKKCSIFRKRFVLIIEISLFFSYAACILAQWSFSVRYIRS